VDPTTSELRDLMTAALEHEDRYTPDLDWLIRAGRRQVRRRRIVSVLAIAAAICVTGGATTVAFQAMARADVPATRSPAQVAVPPQERTGSRVTPVSARIGDWKQLVQASASR
jgi:hypothetical protein